MHYSWAATHEASHILHEDAQTSRSCPRVACHLVLCRLHSALREQRERCGARDVASNRMVRMHAAKTKVVLDQAILERVKADDGKAATRGQSSDAVPHQIAQGREFIVDDHAQRLEDLRRVTVCWSAGTRASAKRA